jgi:glutaminase
VQIVDALMGPSGSSAAGLAALDAFTTYSDWTIF